MKVHNVAFRSITPNFVGTVAAKFHASRVYFNIYGFILTVYEHFCNGLRVFEFFQSKYSFHKCVLLPN